MSNGKKKGLPKPKKKKSSVMSKEKNIYTGKSEYDRTGKTSSAVKKKMKKKK